MRGATIIVTYDNSEICEMLARAEAKSFGVEDEFEKYRKYLLDNLLLQFKFERRKNENNIEM